MFGVDNLIIMNNFESVYTVLEIPLTNIGLSLIKDLWIPDSAD